jgi:hypothetical protein
MPARSASKKPVSKVVATVKPHAEVYASIAYAAAAAHSASYMKELPSWYGTVMFFVCIAALIFGFGWGAYRLIRPRSGN